MSDEKRIEVLRGQMYYADLDPVVGSEQGGFRPVLVIQNDVGNNFSPTVIVTPITSKQKKMRQPTHVGIPPYFNLPENSVAMLEHIRTIDKSRLGEYIGRLDDDVMDYIDGAFGVSIGIEKAFPSVKQQKKREREAADEMVLCLCPVCARQFFNSPDYVIQRIGPITPKDTCTYCNVRMGRVYRVTAKKKRMGDDRP